MSKAYSSCFVIALVAYFVFAAIEEFIPGFVSRYFNPQWLFIPVVILLILMLAFGKNGQKEKVGAKPERLNYVLLFVAGLITLTIIWIGAKDLALFWRGLVAVYGGVLVVGMLSVLLKE